VAIFLCNSSHVVRNVSLPFSCVLYFNSHPTLLLLLSSSSSLPFKHSAPCQHTRPLLSECPQALAQGQVLLTAKIPHHPHSMDIRRLPMVNRLLHSRAHIMDSPAQPPASTMSFYQRCYSPLTAQLSLVKSAAQPPPYNTARARIVAQNPQAPTLPRVSKVSSTNVSTAGPLLWSHIEPIG
jgi:hypothetical protein